MSKMRSILTLLVLGTALAACGSEPTEPANTPPGDRLSAILSKPGPATTCFPADQIPAPPIDMDGEGVCPDSGAGCANMLPYRWCKLDGKRAIVMCEKGGWVVKAKECP